MAKQPFMSKAEFSRAFALATSGIPMDLAEFMRQDKFCGFAQPGFEPVCCTLQEMAQLIAYQSFTFAGTIDHDALDEIWNCRRKFLIIGEGSDEHVQAQQARLTALSTIEAAYQGAMQCVR